MIVLDTHALVWWVSDPDRIPARARRLVDATRREGGLCAVSSISAWEIAMLVAHERLVLSIDLEAWIAAVEALPYLQFVPVDNRLAVQAVRLDRFPQRDPADRIIVATALA
ncbi:MAG: type II toxin-antitoxin system VapC family toxin, partial [Gemmatimonadales bacterium]